MAYGVVVGYRSEVDLIHGGGGGNNWSYSAKSSRKFFSFLLSDVNR